MTSRSQRFPLEGAHEAKLPPLQRKLLAWGTRKSVRGGVKGILLEGEKLVEEALASGHPLKAVWFTDDVRRNRPDIIKRLEESGTTMLPMSARTMRQVSDLDTPPGIAAVGPEPHFLPRHPGAPFSLIVALPLIQDPGNLGGIIRTADYFGVDELWLGKGSADPFAPKVLRGAMGASFRLAAMRFDDLPTRLAAFQRQGAAVWAAVAHGEDAKPEIEATGARILLLGGESRGLSREYLDRADYRVMIPGAQRGESLNLMVAAGILIYTATFGRLPMMDRMIGKQTA